MLALPGAGRLARGDRTRSNSFPAAIPTGILLADILDAVRTLQIAADWQSRCAALRPRPEVLSEVEAAMREQLGESIAQGFDRRGKTCEPDRDIRQSPAMVISCSRIDPTRVPPRTSTSSPTAAMPSSMSRRLPAMVISATGY